MKNLNMNKNDRRAQKTRRAILFALVELMKDQDATKITVTALAKKANIDRKTFYLHYENIQSVITECQDEIIDNIVNIMNNTSGENEDYISEFFDRLSNLIQQNLEFARLFVRSGAYTYFLKRVGEEITNHLIVYARNTTPCYSEKEFKYAEISLMGTASGIAAIYLRWFEDDMGVSLEELTRIIENCAKAQFKDLHPMN